MSQTLTDFTLPTNAYATFDAITLKRMLIDRLNQTSLFTDQNFAASNMSSVIDIFALSYHTLLYFLNQTSSETMFTEAELYQNMNRIVKAISYSPVGAQTCNLTFVVQDIDANSSTTTYTIPRYSFINANGVAFTFKNDATFTKSTTGVETLTDLSETNLLYQGNFTEYPVQVATGEQYETITLLPGEDILIDHFGIDVYIKPAATNKWEQWQRTTSLFMEEPGAKAFEVRLNENKHYEIKFGNGIIGAQLQSGDQIAIYYLKSDGSGGQLGIGAINGQPLVLFATPQFLEIFTDIKDVSTTYISDSQISSLKFSNVSPSTQFYTGESVEDIRNRAPYVFSSQNRLITSRDYVTFVEQNFANIIADVQVVNNWQYIDGHLKYLLDTVKLSTVNSNPNICLNQVLFADTCDFNNIYVYAIPNQSVANSATIRSTYLTPAQKGSIINAMRDIKTMTTETLIMDPVYVALDFGVNDINETLDTSVKDNTQLVIVRNSSSQKSSTLIQNSVYTILLNYFQNSKLGQVLDITSVVNSILSIDGVQTLYTQRTDNPAIQVVGLSFLVWNPVYPDLDILTTSANITFPYFKYPYLFDTVNLLNKIVVVTQSTTENTVS